MNARTTRWRRHLLLLLALLAGTFGWAAPATAAAPNWPSCGGGIGLIGYSDALDKTTFDGTNVGGLSGTVYDANHSVYYSLVDNEGDTAARIYTLSIPLRNSGLGRPVVTAVTTLTDRNGVPFTGANFDGEGLTLTRNGDWLVTSEVEPSIRRFNHDGRLIAELPVPDRFRIAPAGQAMANAAFEGISLSPSGDNLFVVMELPLSTDGVTLDGRGRNRILRYVPDGDSYKLAAEYEYLTDTLEAISDVLVLNDSTLLVLERNDFPGYGNTIRVYKASLTHATDVTTIESLATRSVRPLTKSLLVDLATCPDDGVPNRQVQPNRLIDNIENLAWAPATRGSQRTLLLLSDDNFNPNQTTRVIALAVTTYAVVRR